ncbi:hypothetical protein JCM10450v2_000211 [Rhodotorula kratochvilovae]
MARGKKSTPKPRDRISPQGQDALASPHIFRNAHKAQRFLATQGSVIKAFQDIYKAPESDRPELLAALQSRVKARLDGEDGARVRAEGEAALERSLVESSDEDEDEGDEEQGAEQGEGATPAADAEEPADAGREGAAPPPPLDPEVQAFQLFLGGKSAATSTKETEPQAADHDLGGFDAHSDAPFDSPQPTSTAQTASTSSAPSTSANPASSTAQAARTPAWTQSAAGAPPAPGFLPPLPPGFLPPPPPGFVPPPPSTFVPYTPSPSNVQPDTVRAGPSQSQRYPSSGYTAPVYKTVPARPERYNMPLSRWEDGGRELSLSDVIDEVTCRWDPPLQTVRFHLLGLALCEEGSMYLGRQLNLAQKAEKGAIRELYSIVSSHLHPVLLAGTPAKLLYHLIKKATPEQYDELAYGLKGLVGMSMQMQAPAAVVERVCPPFPLMKTENDLLNPAQLLEGHSLSPAARAAIVDELFSDETFTATATSLYGSRALGSVVRALPLSTTEAVVPACSRNLKALAHSQHGVHVLENVMVRFPADMGKLIADNCDLFCANQSTAVHTFRSASGGTELIFVPQELVTKIVYGAAHFGLEPGQTVLEWVTNNTVRAFETYGTAIISALLRYATQTSNALTIDRILRALDEPPVRSKVEQAIFSGNSRVTNAICGALSSAKYDTPSRANLLSFVKYLCRSLGRGRSQDILREDLAIAEKASLQPLPRESSDLRPPASRSATPGPSSSPAESERAPPASAASPETPRSPDFSPSPARQNSTDPSSPSLNPTAQRSPAVPGSPAPRYTDTATLASSSSASGWTAGDAPVPPFTGQPRYGGKKKKKKGKGPKWAPPPPGRGWSSG